MQKDYLQIKNLSIRYYSNNETVNTASGIDLRLKDGETLRLVGEAGAGKAITALSVMGLLPPKVSEIVSGSTMLDGEELMKSPEKKMRLIHGRKVAMIFQDPMTSLNPLQTVGEQIDEVTLLYNHSNKREPSNQVGELMEKVGLPKGCKTEYPHQLFGGIKQRMVIAIILTCNPKLLTADKSTTALDVTIQAQISNLMKDLKREYHTSMLPIIYDLGIVVEMCDKMTIMYAGEIVESGSIEQIYSTPLHPYTQDPFNSVPSLDDDRCRLTPIDGLMPSPTNLPAGYHFHPRCPYVTELCKTSPSTNGAENGHRVMCRYWEKQKKGN